MFSNFFPENRAVYEITWKNTVEPGRPQMTVWRMRFLCWISKATDIQTEYIIFIAFPLQQFYTNAPRCYITCTLLVLFTITSHQIYVH